jgi:hypothetical protein
MLPVQAWGGSSAALISCGMDLASIDGRVVVKVSYGVRSTIQTRLLRYTTPGVESVTPLHYTDPATLYCASIDGRGLVKATWQGCVAASRQCTGAWLMSAHPSLHASLAPLLLLSLAPLLLVSLAPLLLMSLAPLLLLSLAPLLLVSLAPLLLMSLAPLLLMSLAPLLLMSLAPLLLMSLAPLLLMSLARFWRVYPTFSHAGAHR